MPSSGIKKQSSGVEQVGFFLVPNFPMLAFSALLDPLRVANWVVGKNLYSWHFVSEDGLPVRSSCDTAISVESNIDHADRFSLIVVCAGIDGYLYHNKRVFAWLRKVARNGAVIAGVGTAAFVLARAGLLNGYRCTIHWEEAERFSQEFPEIDVTDSLFEIDRKRMTCAGSVACLDMMLSLIDQRHGKRLAGDVADELLQHVVRTGDQPQRISLSLRTRVSDPRLLAAIAAMEAHLEDPLPLSILCTLSGLSLRHMQRMFSTSFGCSVTDFYRQLRLRLARKLLMHGSRSILEVAVASGFKSASHFARRYRRLFGRAPNEERRQHQSTKTSSL